MACSDPQKHTITITKQIQTQFRWTFPTIMGWLFEVAGNGAAAAELWRKASLLMLANDVLLSLFLLGWKISVWENFYRWQCRLCSALWYLPGGGGSAKQRGFRNGIVVFRRVGWRCESWAFIKCKMTNNKLRNVEVWPSSGVLCVFSTQNQQLAALVWFECC